MIFVAGISRSGKSHTVAKFIASRNFRHIKASQLLREAGRPLGPLSPAEAEENQHVLAALLTTDSQYAGFRMFLDGHVMIETTDGPYLVPDWFFDRIEIEKIMCITDDPKAIMERRAQHGWIFDPQALAQLQNIERQYAYDQAARLQIPYHEVRGNDLPAFTNAIGASP
jgi:adenylate kinase